VVADRGKEEGRIYRNRGLVYRILDSSGNKVGVPIKASSIVCKPILDNLEKKFAANGPTREALKQRTRNAIDDSLQTSIGDMKSLLFALAQKQVYTVLRQNAEGRLYGITFVDNQNKVVFNGSDLGKGYSAAALQSRLTGGDEKLQPQNEIKGTGPTSEVANNIRQQKQQEKSIVPITKGEGLLEILLSTKEQHDNTPSGLLKKKRKKKRMHHNL
jgi:hypothetical protein